MNSVKKCSSCERILTLDRFKPGDSAWDAAEDCKIECLQLEHDLWYGTSKWTNDALRIYFLVSDQVLVAGMGEIIGINHTPIYRQIRSRGYVGLHADEVFRKVIWIESIVKRVRKKYQPAKGS